MLDYFSLSEVVPAEEQSFLLTAEALVLVYGSVLASTWWSVDERTTTNMVRWPGDWNSGEYY